jgi:Vacuolar sorting protein 9 (VPS9) domain
MWDYAANSIECLVYLSIVFNMMDNRMTPLEKLECMVECFKIITQVLELASAKEGGGGADDTLPILIYVMLRACPRRMHSNLKYGFNSLMISASSPF